MISALFGWWGMPWGPILTVRSIFKNAFGGESPSGSEDRLLWYNAVAFLQQGNRRLALGLARRVAASSDRALAEKASRLLRDLEATAEPSFRDTKDLRFGMGMAELRIADPMRRDRLLFLNALAILLLTLLGAASESLASGLRTSRPSQFLR